MAPTIEFGPFEWDLDKNQKNIIKHRVDFEEASRVFFDPYRIIQKDDKHSHEEPRWLCIGMVEGRVITVRFTKREKVRIFGAGMWREKRVLYEQKKAQQV
jgi:uncharacterized DUF497 family protein